MALRLMSMMNGLDRWCTLLQSVKLCSHGFASFRFSSCVSRAAPSIRRGKCVSGKRESDGLAAEAAVSAKSAYVSNTIVGIKQTSNIECRRMRTRTQKPKQVWRKGSWLGQAAARKLPLMTTARKKTMPLRQPTETQPFGRPASRCHHDTLQYIFLFSSLHLWDEVRGEHPAVYPTFGKVPCPYSGSPILACIPWVL